MATLRSSAGMDASAETNSKCQQIPESDIPKYASLLQVQNVIKKHKSFFKMSGAKDKVESLKEWKEKFTGESSPSSDFERALHETLSYCSAVFNVFRDDRRFHEFAEELASSIVEMRNHMGNEIMPLSKFHAFSRGVFEIKGQTLSSAQYYEEIPFYGPPHQPSDDCSITKFYEWTLVDKPKASIVAGTPIKCTYYLEKGKLFGTYYVLGQSAPGIHATIKSFHGGRPSFFTLEETIVKQLLDKNTKFEASSTH